MLYNLTMVDRSYSLALATATPQGSVTLAHGDKVLGSAEVPQPRRHNVDLMPTIDRLCQDHSVSPAQLGEIYLSIGPGSFTGLRIAVATAKMLALTLNVKIVAVPTLEVVAQNAPPPPDDKRDTTLAVCLNLKRDTLYSGLFGFDESQCLWLPQGEPALRTLEQIINLVPGPLMLLGDPLPEIPVAQRPSRLNILPAAMSNNRSNVVWWLGKSMAKRGQYAEPATLVPLYVRPPEAQELWDRRLSSAPSPHQA
jgi:tRNA threonylcarbamoyladenosine biosynthesis protein TsaB